MSYVEKSLMNGEEILYQAKLHWIVFFTPILLFLVAIVLFAITPVAAVAFLLVSIIMAISSFINYKTSEFAITNKRVIVKVGFIRRDSLEVLLSKVEGIQVSQGILARILGFGSITVSGTGGTKDPFHKISSPLEFRKKAQEQIAIVQKV